MSAQDRQHDHDRDYRTIDGGRAVPDIEPGVGVGQLVKSIGAVHADLTAVTDDAAAAVIATAVIAAAAAADTDAEDIQKNRSVQTHLPKCPTSRFSAEKRFVA